MKRDLLAFLLTTASMGLVMFLAWNYEPRMPRQVGAMELFCQNTAKFTKAERICP